MIVVDETRRITYSNPAARELLGRGGPLVDRDGRLDGADLRGSRELLASIRSLGLGGALVSGGGSDRALLRMSGAGRAVELLVFAIAVRPGATMRVFGDDPCAILIVHPLDAAARLDPLIVSLAFGLTPAEARVATAIAEGASPDEVAADRGVSLATVRTQLRGVFDKLGVRRQAEMVRMLLELPRLRPVGPIRPVLSPR